MPKSIAELEAAVRDAREEAYAYGGSYGTLDAYASAVRALTWAKAREAVENAEWRFHESDWSGTGHKLMWRDDALTALRDAEEQDK